MATGALLDELRKNRDTSVQAVTEAKTATTGSVLSAAVAELDTEAGTARLLAAVAVSVAQDGGEPTEKRVRLELTLTKTDNEWKASALAQIPAG